jgi:hypothetical protein
MGLGCKLAVSRLTAGLALLTVAGAALGQITVGTDSTVTATYSGANATAGPFPWSDLGINANASVTPGDLSVATGGSTAFTFTNDPSAGTVLSTNTAFNVNYTPGWTGSLSQGSVSGNVNSNLVYSIGALNGSTNLINVPLSSSSSPTTDLGASLNAASGPPVSSSVSGAGPSANVGYTLSAGACAFVCVTLASASLGVTLGTQVQQSATVTPTVTYGDLVWVSTTLNPSYSATDPQAFIAGNGGTITQGLNGITSGLGLTNGQTFHYNILPEVILDLSVTSQAQLSLPASITASYNVLGVGGSQSFPLGNLYTLGTGAEDFDVSTTFHNNDYYSIPIMYEPSFGLAGPGEVGVVEGLFTGHLPPDGSSGGLPPDSGPCAGMPAGCTLSVTGGSGTIGGYGETNEGPLIPPCAPAGAPYDGACINQVTLNPTAAPEIDPATSGSAMTLLLGTLMVMRGRRRAT